MKYPYRFKTEEEMIDTLGQNWKESFDTIGWVDRGRMDFLLGQIFPFTKEELNFEGIRPLGYGKYEGWSIHWDMLTKNKPRIPSYNPKKMDRTLESVKEEWYPYRFKTEEEMVKDFGEDWRYSNTFPGFGWGDLGMNHLLGKPFPFKSDVLTVDNYGENSQVFKERRHFFDEFGIYWSISWKMLTKNKPSYEPRKIDRTLESLNENIRFFDKNDNIYKEKVLPKFKIGDIVMIKKNGYLIHKNNIPYIDNEDRLNYFKENENKKIEVKELALDIEINNWYCLINKTDFIYEGALEFYGPTYKPKRIEKTFENYKINEEYQSGLPDDIRDSFYFSHYDAFVIIFDNDVEEEKFNTIMKMLISIFNVKLPYFEDCKFYMIENQFYVIITINKSRNTIETGWNTVDPNIKFKNQHFIRDYKFPTPFYINDIDNVNKVKNILKYGNVIPSYEPRKIDRTLESNKYSLYRFKTKEEFIRDFGDRWRDRVYLYWVADMDYLLGEDIDNNEKIQMLYDEIIPYCGYGRLNISKDMITKNKTVPNYNPRKIDRTLESYELLLEKSSLTKLGVPIEVMQPIQKDFAIPADAQWDRLRLKRGAQQILRKGNKELLLQIAVDSIKVFVAYPRGSEIIYFIDNYVYNDSGWGGEFEKLERQYTTMTQLFYQIDSSTLLYHLKSDFSLIKQPKRKLIKKEKRFQEFTENFKKDFLNNFESILKRIVGTKYMDAKKEIDDKARQIEIENQMMITGLSDPLSGPNSLSILDEFIMQFEDEYSDYFGERLDIEELSNYFSREKIMTAFMYYIYTGKLLNK